MGNEQLTESSFKRLNNYDYDDSILIRDQSDSVVSPEI